MRWILFLLATSLATAEPDLVPWPRTYEAGKGELHPTRVVATTTNLLPLARVLAGEMVQAGGTRLEVASGAARTGDIALVIDTSLRGEAYTVRVADTATVRGGNYAAVALGTVTLLQSLRGGALPACEIQDEPRASYRGLLVDVARKFHSIETLKQCVVLCRLYKIRYLQLHLTDDQSFTFSSTAYPLLTTKNHHGGPAYILEQLRELEQFAVERGVVIVPEFEMPGHAGAMNRAMPELFKIKGTKPYEHHASINFVNDKVLAALDTIIGEMCDVFRASPYFHIGGDEADIAFAHQHPEFQAAMKETGLTNQWQLYRRFLVRMNETVKQRGKQMIVWEGFHREPKSQVQIPKDIIVMVYESQFYLPQHLVEDGYTVINAAWTPLYVVNARCQTVEHIFQWNPLLWGKFTKEYDKTKWFQLQPSPLVIGAQMCAWEQPQDVEIPSLRQRLPAMSERIWSPDLGRSAADFQKRLQTTDRLYESLRGANTNGTASVGVRHHD